MIIDIKKIAFILINPFIIGFLGGMVSGNISLGLYSAVLAFLFWGSDWYSSYITMVTVIMVSETGNINFELVFVNILCLTYILRLIDYNFLFPLVSLLLFYFIDTWQFLMGLTPVHLLEEANIAGSVILLAGLLLAFQRGVRKLLCKLGTAPVFWGGYLVYLLMLTGSLFILLPFNLVMVSLGIIISFYLLIRFRPPLPEVAYFALILGMLAGRWGFLQ